MNIESLFTEKTTINISVVKLHNQKINKTIFNQLLINSPFTEDFHLRRQVHFFGFVNEKVKWMLWTDDESIYKYEMERAATFTYLNLDNEKLDEFMKIYPTRLLRYFKESHDEDDHHNEYDNDRTIVSAILNEEEKLEIENKQVIISRILDELNERQIFL